ncbi:hypothetical protein JCM10212_003349 [Sporobolomyces blumeae]
MSGQGSEPPGPPAPPPPAGFGPGSFVPLPPLPPGWTQHRAPGGQAYYFNPTTNVSTYVRPLPTAPPPPPPPPPGFAIAPGGIPSPVGFPLNGGGVPGQFAPPLHFGGGGGGGGGTDKKGKKDKDKKEKPKDKVAIEGTPWIRVTTNKGNVFYNHKETKESVWTVPDEIKGQVEALEERERRDKEERDKEERGRREQEEERERVEREVEEKRKEEEEEKNARKRKVEEEEEEAEGEGEAGEEGHEKGDLDIEIEGSAERAVPSRSPSISAAATTGGEGGNADVEGEPKKKKIKTRVVSSIEELESEEDWQRQMAEQMAREVEEEEAREKKEIEALARPASDAIVPESQFEVNQVEAAALYKVLLAEKDINPMAPFENELPKFVNDPRYHAVKNTRERRDLFDEFCKDKLREQRAAKKRLAQSGVKADPLADYRTLLSTTVTSTRTHFSDFKKAHGKDARFRAFGKLEGEKEKEFKRYLRELGEKKREAAEKAEREFAEMLSEDQRIQPKDQWADVKKRHASDPRYAAVNSSSLREQLFKKHLSSLSNGSRSSGNGSSSATPAPNPTSASSTTSKEDRAARAAASLKEREERVRMEKMRSERSANQARGHLGKEEAEREFGQLLIDAVRDHNARFDDVVATLSRDPRFDHPALSPRDKRHLFDSHLSSLHKKRVNAIETLFAEHAPRLDTPFHDVLPEISTSPQVTRLVGNDYDALEQLYESWTTRRAVRAKDEFYELLKESPILEHWGRLRKMEKREQVKLIGEEGTRNDESDDDEPDQRDMADQVDLKAVHATLKNDKRYLQWSHEPEKRDEWIEDYVENRLTAPKTTVHQRD